MLVPPVVVTTIWTVPAPGGATAVILTEETTENEVAATPPNVTAVTPVNPVPVSVTVVPAIPEAGELT